jgi:hypothetical protein
MYPFYFILIILVLFNNPIDLYRILYNCYRINRIKQSVSIFIYFFMRDIPSSVSRNPFLL